MASSRRVLLGTVGYHLLGNHSVGPILYPELTKLKWPDGIDVKEMNWSPIAIVQEMESMEDSYDRVVMLVAVERSRRKIGEITIFQWMGGLPDENQIQACIGDAATGVISIQNLLVIGEHFDIWPRELFLVDVEPGPEQSGEKLTDEVAQQIPLILDELRYLVTEDSINSNRLFQLNGLNLFTEHEIR